MELDVRTLYVMYAVLYLVLHGIIWFSLARYHSRLVSRWSAAGIVSAAGIGLLAMQGVWPEWIVASFGQIFMAAGNFARQHVLRSVDQPPTMRWLWGLGLFHLAYLLLNGGLFLSGASHAQMMLVFFAFYALVCLEFFFSGRAIGRQRQTSGARTLQLGGLVFTCSLGIKALALAMGWGAQGLYDSGWDQVALFAAQILAIGLLNFGFMQMFVDQFQQERVLAEQSLLVQRERALQAERQSQDLTQVLREREEIIHQLTLSSKTAGMGALVSGIAHEINQPLTTIILKTQLIDAHLSTPQDLDAVRSLCERIRQDTHHAARMIATLRSMFAMGHSGFARMDLVELLRQVVVIVRHRADRLGIALMVEVPQTLHLTADASQLQQVVLNLLNNAMQSIAQARPVQPRIAVHACGEGDSVVMTVRDNGAGIDPLMRDDVFALFKSDRARHMGVGLWLSQAVVHSHGGQLSFESIPAEGTEFTLRLPKRDNAIHG